MSRLLIALVCAPSILEICIIAYAAYRTQQFFFLWAVLATFTLTKFTLKYAYLLRPAGGHEKLD